MTDKTKKSTEILKHHAISLEHQHTFSQQETCTPNYYLSSLLTLKQMELKLKGKKTIQLGKPSFSFFTNIYSFNIHLLSLYQFINNYVSYLFCFVMMKSTETSTCHGPRDPTLSNRTISY